MTKNEFKSAKAWRLARELSVQQLADLTGYSIESIYFMEKGGRPVQPVTEYVWRRYKTACAGVDAQMRGERFDW